MYHIMIVDDNHLSVEGITQNIVWESLDAMVCHKVYDGESALTILKSEPIDLIISDIEMPQLNGLDMAKAAFSINPLIKIILISAFDKFEYAKQAIRVGAYDYVEKPLDYNYLDSKIRNALEALSNEKKNLELLKHSKPIMRDHFFSDLLTSFHSNKKHTLSNYQDYLDINLHYHYFQVIIIQIDNAKQRKNECKIEEYHLQLMVLSDSLKKQLGSHFNLLHILTSFDSLKVILGHNYSNAKDFQKISYDFFTEISEAYEDKLLDLKIGLGSIVKYPWDLALSHESASKSLEYCFFFPQKNIFDIRDTLGQEVTHALFQTKHEDQLVQLLCKKDLSEIKRWIDELSMELSSNYRTKNLIFIQIYSLLGRLLRFLYEMDIDSKEIEKEILETYRRIETFNYSTEIFEWLYYICTLTCQQLDSSVKNYHERICSLVIEYISNNYSNSGLSLNELADYVNVSPAHLSALFKKTQKENITEIITATRMKTAKNLLINTSFSLKEISEKTGYTNQYYFSSCFKKNTGKTPSLYREEHA